MSEDTAKIERTSMVGYEDAGLGYGPAAEPLVSC
jgi:hypothetical protein